MMAIISSARVITIFSTWYVASATTILCRNLNIAVLLEVFSMCGIEGPIELRLT